MEKLEPDILSYLLTDKYFRDYVLSSNEKKNLFLKDWLSKHPNTAPEVEKAIAYIRAITFEVNHLIPDELDELLEHIYASG